MVLKFLFGSVNDRIIKSYRKTVDKINVLEPVYEKLSDEELRAKTSYFKDIVAKGTSLDEILPDAFAIVREASKRTLGLRHFDVQLLGGMILHNGMIAEMRTGEGKTLMSTLAIYLNALSNKGVHVVTVNDYLAQRDSIWMGKIYEFLGLTVGCVIHGVDDDERKNAYSSDITYGTNNEFGFDYLRDNMKFSKEHMVQRDFNFAIIDEVDSILIDESRTPLIISGPTRDNSDLYQKVDKIIPKLGDTDYDKDEKTRAVTLTDEGINKVEQLLIESGLIPSDASIYDIENVSVLHHINQALKAHKSFTKDVDYLVKDGKVVIIDEFTGRMMEGRRYSEGLHQAIEAKENVKIQNESQTLASVTYQNYFRLYPKLAGMTGTAMTEAGEFRDIYKLDIVDVPTNLPVKRVDEDDAIYRTAKEKYDAIIEEIKASYEKGQPVLVGTVSIEKSEYLSNLLKKAKIQHNVLNAKYHEQEAMIIAQAGRFKAVTIATNMAGRGTDIMLGGNPEMLIKEQHIDEEDQELYASKLKELIIQLKEEKEKVLAAGGLFVLGTERHESRRIDNQLRGRSGRQGDPGRTKFFLSLEDDLMRIFGSDRISSMLQKLGLKEGEAIFHPWISKAIEKSQKRVEEYHYEIRKSILRFDDVMNDQRKVIYEQRLDIIQSEDVSDVIKEIYEEINNDLVEAYFPRKSYSDQWDIEGFEKEIHFLYGVNANLKDYVSEEGVGNEEICAKLDKLIADLLEVKAENFGTETMRMAEKRFLLITLDEMWKDHLIALDHLKQGIGLRAYAQKDPLNEYKREAFMMFANFLTSLRREYIRRISHMEVTYHSNEVLADDFEPEQKMVESHGEEAAEKGREVPKVGRNEPCPCNSGKKYKHCHGVI